MMTVRPHVGVTGNSEQSFGSSATGHHEVPQVLLQDLNLTEVQQHHLHFQLEKVG